MKMQELIGEYRKEIPVLVKDAEQVAELYKRLNSLIRDFANCQSDVARAMILDGVKSDMNMFDHAFVDMMATVEKLEGLNSGYTRTLGPRAAKPVEDPRQMKLPLEGE